MIVTKTATLRDKYLTRGKILELQSLENFLLSVERRAYRIAVVSLLHREDALDAVQEAMTQLVARYRDKNWEEWRPLFYRILHSKIIDAHRKRKLQQRFSGWLGSGRDHGENDDIEDPLQNAAGPEHLAPEPRRQNAEAVAKLDVAIQRLPVRQQQAFMLRCWEGLSTRETACAMRCSEGSVKTHYSRAIHSLRSVLGDYYE